MGCGMYPTLSSTCWAVAGTARLAPSARLPPPTVLRKVRRLISSPPLLLREEGSSLAGSAARPPSRRECGLPSLHCQDGEALGSVSVWPRSSAGVQAIAAATLHFFCVRNRVGMLGILLAEWAPSLPAPRGPQYSVNGML